ncbi:hypothetical protein [Reinekea sp.]|jgi:hypothetical protein|uniref:hypothetical protein n=1 Tax=Reinekea sp. TaxID=1970455 RepID=UPI002A800539|nr:hypothetical protein [Reinekea sp.]
MGREFTNALQQTPLWHYANRVYLPNKELLLAWQNDNSAQVNDIIAIVYALQQGLTLPAFWWQGDRHARLRRLIERTRRHRQGLDGALKRNALAFELMLEGLDIQLLQYRLVPAEREAIDLVGHYALFLGVEKGALAPLIDTLLRVPDPDCT